MTEFSTAYRLKQITSSPHYPKSNGLAERTVQTIKAMLEKSKDPHLALLGQHAAILRTVVWIKSSRIVDGEIDQDYIPYLRLLDASYQSSHILTVG